MPKEFYRLVLVTLDNTPPHFEEMSATKPKQQIELIIKYEPALARVPAGTRLDIVLNGSKCPCLVLGYEPAPDAKEEGIVYLGPLLAR